MKDLLNCPNCGAPIKGSKCEYCGTIFSEKYDDDLSDLNEKIRLATINISQYEQTHNILNSIGPLHYNAILSGNDIRQITQISNDICQSAKASNNVCQSIQTSIDELNRFQYQNLRASTNIYPYVEHVPYPETKETFWQKVKNWWNMNGYLFGF